MSFIYLASPYSDDSIHIVNKRYQQVLEVTAQLLNKDIFIYSPIVHCHELAREHALPKDFAFWKKYNESMLSASAALWILQLEGWDKSKGVRGEIKFAIENRIPIAHIPYPLSRFLA